jgi:hypothetical protein
MVRASLLVGSWLAISALMIGVLTMATQGAIAPLWIFPKASPGPHYQQSYLPFGMASLPLLWSPSLQLPY